MNILKQSRPQKSNIDLTVGTWKMLYYVSTFIELDSIVIVCYDWDEIKQKPPSEGFYYGRTVWCYDKKTKEVLWIIEEPPVAKNKDGIIWNRNGNHIPSDWPKLDRNESYLNLDYNKFDDQVYVDTTGAREFILDIDTGKVTFVRDGLR